MKHQDGETESNNKGEEHVRFGFRKNFAQHYNIQNAILWKSQQRSGQRKGRELVGPSQGAETADYPQREYEFPKEQRDDVNPQRAPHGNRAVQSGYAADSIFG
jgi:hypothetical protein